MPTGGLSHSRWWFGRQQPSLSERRLRCANHDISLQPQLFAFYAWLAQRQHNGLPPVRHTDANPAEFLTLYAASREKNGLLAQFTTEE